MEKQTKTPVQVLQEIIAIHTSRKEAIDKLKEQQISGDLAASFLTASRQSDQYISALMNELSSFGDAVISDVDRDNAYHATWKKALENIASVNPKEYGQTFKTLEESLKKTYQDFLQTNSELPGSLRELLTAQLAELTEFNPET